MTDSVYLAGDAIGLTTVVAGWLVAGPQRRMMLLAGGLQLALLPLGLWWAPTVWTPVRMVGGWLPLEDAICAFGFGAGAWCMATLAFRESCVAQADLRQFLHRAVLVTVPAAALYAALHAAGVNGDVGAFVVPMAVAGWLLARDPDLLPLAICGGVGCALFYYAELRLWFAMWPQARGWWAPFTVWDQDFAGVPAGEIAWALMIGAAHPTVVAFLCAVRRRVRAAAT